MAAKKVTLSLDEEVHDFAVRAAKRAGLSTSAWLTRVARREAVRIGCGPVLAAGAADDAVTDEYERQAAEEDLRAAG